MVMAILSSPALGMLRCRVSLRRSFVWLLLSLLLAGAASYSCGSRYALVGHSPIQAASSQTAGLKGHNATPPQAATSATPTSAIQTVRAVHQAGPFVEPVELGKDCCQRNKAPRGEPAPLRTGAVDPPSVLHRLPGDGTFSTDDPPNPDLPALTVVQLSISRT